MISWIRYNFGLNNAIILIVVIVVITGFLIGPSLYLKLKGSQYQGTAKAEITDIIAAKAVSQHLNGTNETITGYKVTYIYSIHNKAYPGTEFIKPGSDIKHLYDIVSSGKPCFVEVKYSISAPSESMISKLNPD